MDWIAALDTFAAGEAASSEAAASEGVVARVVIVSVNGPTPRAEGTAMLVTPTRHEGRIGRQHVTSELIVVARRLMAQRRTAGPGPAWLREQLSFTTGPVLGEATGGILSVVVEVFGQSERSLLSALFTRRAQSPLIGRPPFIGRSMAPGAPPMAFDERGEAAPASWREAVGALLADPVRTLALTRDSSAVIERIEPHLTQFHVYGTGLAARALVKLLVDLPFAVIWHDSAPAHFPQELPAGVTIAPGAAPAAAAAAARPGSFHAVMTNDHALDLAVCQAVATDGRFGFLGVIGSRLKQQRLKAILHAQGLNEPTLARIACPIGLAQIRGKSPAVIALSIAAQAVIVLQGTQEVREQG